MLSLRNNKKKELDMKEKDPKIIEARKQAKKKMLIKKGITYFNLPEAEIPNESSKMTNVQHANNQT